MVIYLSYYIFVVMTSCKAAAHTFVISKLIKAVFYLLSFIWLYVSLSQFSIGLFCFPDAGKQKS